MTAEVSIPIAFFGGILSFISPCVLPLVPSYISFVTGISFEELTGENAAGLKKVILLNSLMFILGFSTVFVVILGASENSQAAHDNPSDQLGRPTSADGAGTPPRSS